jgi:ABC-type glycerol-3-phosphate transport system substrate-binding protein
MDTRNGDIYNNRALAEAAGVPDEDIVTGSREALEKLARKIKALDQRGSFKNVDSGCGGPTR